MKELVDAFWRAAAYRLHPRVIGLSLRPLLIGAALSGLAWWLFWDGAVAAVQSGLPRWPLVGTLAGGIESWVGPGVRAVMAPTIVVVPSLPVIVVVPSLPVIVVVSVLLVGLPMTPAIVTPVGERRFPSLALAPSPPR